jgi:predicted HTH domain antitoxin
MVQEEKYHELHFTERGLMEITRISLFKYATVSLIAHSNHKASKVYGISLHFITISIMSRNIQLKCARAVCVCDRERGVYPKTKRVERERDEKLKEYTADLLSSCGNRRCLIHCSTSRRLNDISDLLEGRTVNS